MLLSSCEQPAWPAEREIRVWGEAHDPSPVVSKRQ
jgi:hypothetical protein